MPEDTDEEDDGKLEYEDILVETPYGTRDESLAIVKGGYSPID